MQPSKGRYASRTAAASCSRTRVHGCSLARWRCRRCTASCCICFDTSDQATVHLARILERYVHMRGWICRADWGKGPGAGAAARWRRAALRQPPACEQLQVSMFHVPNGRIPMHMHAAVTRITSSTCKIATATARRRASVKEHLCLQRCQAGTRPARMPSLRRSLLCRPDASNPQA